MLYDISDGSGFGNNSMTTFILLGLKGMKKSCCSRLIDDLVRNDSRMIYRTR